MSEVVDLLLKGLDCLADIADDLVVVKLNNTVVQNDKLLETFALDVASLTRFGVNFAIIHEGMGEQLENVKFNNFNEQEVRDVFINGWANQRIVEFLNLEGVSAVSLSGKANRLVQTKIVRKVNKQSYKEAKKVFDLGFANKVSGINTDFISNVLDHGFTPVICPSFYDSNGACQALPTEVASGIASTFAAGRYVVFADKLLIDKSGKIIHAIDSDKLSHMLESAKFDAGLKKEAEYCVKLVQLYVDEALILSADTPHILMSALLSKEFKGNRIEPLFLEDGDEQDINMF